MMNDENLVSFESRVAGLLAHHGKQTADPASLYQAPGRVNLLGEHTDYSGGFCMPAALNFNTLVAASRRTDSLLRMHSLDFNESAEVDLASIAAPGNPTGARTRRVWRGR